MSEVTGRKISDLTALTAENITDNDLLYIVNSSESKKTTVGELKKVITNDDKTKLNKINCYSVIVEITQDWLNKGYVPIAYGTSNTSTVVAMNGDHDSNSLKILGTFRTSNGVVYANFSGGVTGNARINYIMFEA